MTNTSADQDLRATLEGTLADFPVSELLGLLSSTRQTGTLQVAVRPAVLLTIVDGRVAFASTDPAATVRDLLVDGGHVSAALWQLTVSGGIDATELGEALVEAGADRDTIQRAIREHVVTACEKLVDQPAARFRFVRQPRTSMGEAFTCPIDLLRERLLERSAAWAELRTIVATDDARVEINPDLPPRRTEIVIEAADWRVLLALDATSTPRILAAELGSGVFATTRAVARLYAAGAVRVDGRVVEDVPADDVPASGPEWAGAAETSLVELVGGTSVSGAVRSSG